MIALHQIQLLTPYYETTITEAQLDEMGHMNIRHYVGIFDDTTWNLFESFGMTLDYYQQNQSGAFALEQHINYLAEVRLGEKIAVYPRILGRTYKRIHFMHFMVNLTRKNIAATFEVIGSHADMGIRRTSPFPPKIAQNIDNLLTLHNQLAWLAPVCGVMKP